MNRINIYNFLLKLYIAEGDSKKAKGLWLNLEEENIPPSQKFLNELGEFLKKIGEPLPFSLDQTKVCFLIKYLIKIIGKMSL